MKKRASHSPAVKPARWLLLVHQLPPKPAYLRVKVWRRLQTIGAVAVKNSVYALPADERRREDFQWLIREIEQSGGEGLICEAELVDGMRDDELRIRFDTARDADYSEVAKDLRALSTGRKRKKEDVSDLTRQVHKLRQRFVAIAAIDFFGATGRMSVDALLGEAEKQLSAETSAQDSG